MPPEPDADLDWTAHLYATGALSRPEEAAFELRLADDQLAREAVAGAVGLIEALAAAGPSAWIRPRRHPARRALAWSALAAAACLILATSWALRPGRATPPDAAEVAIAWSGLRRLEAIGGPEIDFVAPADDAHPSAELDPPTDPALPSWLLTAAAKPRVDAPQQEN